jgi:hypothetical protein
MRRLYHKNIFFILMLLLQAAWGFSQQETSVILQKFQNYADNNYQEKVFLHTDKTVYAIGEVIWFKAYILNAQNNTPSLLSKICYVEVLSDENKPMLQGKISIDSGRGNGSFLLPASIPTGNYLLRAYTNWMKNFDPQFYFQQTIGIVNPDKKPETKKDSTTFSEHIEFFPEGGNLVAGLDNTVGFKVSDAYGRGIPAKGIILSQNNDTVATFETEHFGMGRFSFTPQPGIQYHTEIILHDKTITKALPKIFNKGWVMHVTNDNTKLSVQIKCNKESTHHVFLFIQAHNRIRYARVQPLEKGSTVFTLNKADMAEGISQLTIFNEEEQPVCERLWFKRPSSMLKINAATSNPPYTERSKVNLDISAADTGGIPVNANLSVSVYLTDSLQPAQKANIVNYVWLSSEIPGFIESPGYYFENTEDAAAAADDLMLTQGWRRFKWEDVLKNDKPAFTYLPEYERHIITGRVIPKIHDLPDSGIIAYLSIVGKNFRFCNTTSGTNGVLQFNVQKFFGNREMIVQTGVADSNYHILVDNAFSDQYTQTMAAPIHLTPSLANSIMQRSIGSEALNAYEPAEVNSFTIKPYYDTTVFYGIPYESYNLDDYTRFPTMEEVMREYVKEVKVRKKDKDFSLHVFDIPVNDYFEDNPLVLLDGVPVWNVNKVMDIDPLKIQRVAVTASEFYQGKIHYEGIVSYNTYNGDLNGYNLDPNSLALEYDGLQLQREFYSPQYETQQEQRSRLPDFRNVLYWSPDIETGDGKRSINFYTSDIPGKYVVLVQGISGNGEAGVAVTTFTVSATKSQ